MRLRLSPLAATLFILVQACSSASDEGLTTAASFAVGSDVSAMTGTISSLGGSCPSLTFLFERRTVRTEQSTAFGEGGCAALKNTMRVEVSGTVISDGVVKATRIAPIGIVTTTPSTPTTPSTSVTYTGNITALTGTCPALVITVGERRASTTATTLFNVRACGDFKVGSYVEITGASTTTANLFVATSVTGRK